MPRVTRAQLEALRKAVGCPECDGPDVKIRVIMHTTELDEDGRLLPIPPSEPTYCEVCGRPGIVIRMKGLPDKIRGDGSRVGEHHA